MWPFRGRKQTETDDPEGLLRQRIVLLNGKITDNLSITTIAQLLFLENEDPHRSITLRIGSLGGAMSAGLAVLDTIRTLKVPVHASAPTHAHSIALAILAGGKKGERSVGSKAEFSLGEVRQINPAKSNGDLDRIRGLIIEKFAELTGQIPEYVNQQMLLDRNFNSSEAIAFGLADRIEG